MAPRTAKSQKRLTAARRVKFNRAAARARSSSRSVRPARSKRSVRSVRSTRSVRSVRSARSVRSVRPARSVRSVRSVRPTRAPRPVPSLPDVESVTSSRRSCPEGYENIVLYYLAKLRKLFQPQPRVGSESCDTSGTSVRRGRGRGLAADGPRSILDVDPARFARKVGSDGARQKVLNIVSAAIDYGRANNVVARKGNVFWLRRQRPSTGQKIAKREATPGPRGRHCSQCRQIQDGRRGRSLTVSPSASLFDGVGGGSGSRTSLVTSVRTGRSRSRSRSRSQLRQKPAQGRVTKAAARRRAEAAGAGAGASSAAGRRLSTRRPTGARGRKSKVSLKMARSASRGASLARTSRSRSRSRSALRTRGILKDKCNCSLCRLTKGPKLN